jgi:hypothetical protein
MRDPLWKADMAYIHSYRVTREPCADDVLEIVSYMPIYEYQPGFNADRIPLLVNEISGLLGQLGVHKATVLPMPA